MKKKISLLFLFLGIFLLAAFFRLYGVNWDQGQHLHPDERFLTMVANGISWPKNIGEYLDTAISPLNPHNRGFGFFVYGTFPVFFTKWVAETLGKGDYSNLTLIGRSLSALFDLGTVLLVFLIGNEILRNKPINTNKYQSTNKLKNGKMEKIGLLDNWIIGLFAAFFYAASVLPIQLSHFYAVDTYLTFFLTLSFYLLIKIINTPARGWSALGGKYYILYTLLGLSFGLALASKISAVFFLPIIGSGFLFYLIKTRNFRLFFVLCSLFFVATFLTFRLAQPYAFATSNIFDFTLNPKLLDNWKQLEGFMKPDSGFPPSVQWFGITPYLFPFANLMLWGLGLPLGIISMISISYYVLRITYHTIRIKFSLILNSKFLILNLSLLWILLLFIYQASQPAPTIRYFLPIYPFLAIIAAYFIVQVFNKFKIGLSGYRVIGLFVILWPLAFLNIYSNKHPRVLASEWIFKNIPYGATIATEHWDDGLPMTIDAQRISQLYKYVSLPLYDPDKSEKWEKVAKFLNESDYIVLSSNRLWGSITKAPKLFPQTSKYYKYLFDGSLGFEKIAEITSFPSLPIPLGNTCVYLMPPEEYYLKLKSDKSGLIRIDSCNLYEGINYQGIIIRDELAEETFTVYDHPKVLIFKKVKPVDYLNLLDDHNYKE